MKKRLLTIGLLIAIDQTIKLLIASFAMDKRITWIPGVLRFEPKQNTNLNWFGAIMDLQTPVILMIILQTGAFILFMLFYHHYSKKYKRMTNLLNVSFCLVLAGIGCSFIDVIFWGGSLDFVGLFDWFIFDTKDVFLNAGSIGCVMWLFINEQKAKVNNNNL